MESKLETPPNKQPNLSGGEPNCLVKFLRTETIYIDLNYSF